MSKQAIAFSIEKLAEDGISVTPASALLTAEEVNKIMVECGCRDLLPTPQCTINPPYRTVDGTCNNPVYPLRGAAGTAFRRILPPCYEDGISSIRGDLQNYGNLSGLGPFDPPYPSVRFVTNNIVLDQEIDEMSVSHMLMQWGQFLDHEMTLTPQLGEITTCDCCNKTDICLPIKVPHDDPTFGVGTIRNGTCIPFRRSVPACSNSMDGTFDPRQQINDVSSYIDASVILGPDLATAYSIRAFSGGRLRVGYILPGNTKPSLPVNGDTTGFVAGDKRVNDQPGLMIIQTIWMREHNRIADELASINPGWNDERLYQEARRILGAEFQRITYFEWLPTIMGLDTFNALIGPYSGYNPNVDASLPTELSTAALRVGHSFIRPNFPRLESDFNTSILAGDLQLAFSGMIEIYNSSFGTDPLLRGLLTAPARRSDEFLSNILTNRLFEGPPGTGTDLASRNLQRGRDHGIAPYSVYKKFCSNFYGVSSPFDRESTFAKFIETYGSLDTVDLWVGGISERSLPNSHLGATFACIFANAFSNLRDGDAFYFERRGVFTPPQVKELSKASLSRVICDNSDGIIHAQTNAFVTTQLRVACSSLPSVNLTTWKEVKRVKKPAHGEF